MLKAGNGRPYGDSPGTVLHRLSGQSMRPVHFLHACENGAVHGFRDEVLALADQLDHAPAGASGVLGAIVFIFLLLLITDILGFTKVYPFTRSIR